MNIGKLNKKVHIQQSVETYSHGEVVKEWVDYKAPFVEFVSQSGREFFKIQQRFSEVEAVLRTWYIPGITTKMRIKYGEEPNARYFRIIAVEDVAEQHRETLIACKEVVGDENI
jgi:SPP1 family predicted phage head-tail adaptor